MRKIKEKRRNLRFPNNYPVKIIADKRVEYKGIIKDINQKGAFIVIKGPFRLGQKLVLEFQSSQLKNEIRICNIIRIVPNGVGIQFDKPLGDEFSTPMP
jgi:hypothetical protein